MLAIACGSIVSVWDTTSSKASSSIQTQHYDTTTNRNLLSSSSSSFLNGMTHFIPHGNSSILTDIAWNHNGQIIASCARRRGSPSIESSVVAAEEKEEPFYDLILTHAKRHTRLEAFQNDTPNQDDHHHPVDGISSSPTSIGFGGKAAKSRYICISNSNSSISIWDMKKSSRVRQFGIVAPSSSSSSLTWTQVGCIRAAIDPTDTFVAALSGVVPTLSIFRLREGDLHWTIDLSESPSHEETASSSANNNNNNNNSIDTHCATCFQYSNLDPQRIATGKRNGTVLVWDISHHSSSSSSSSDTIAVVPSYDRMKYCHKKSISEIAFSPIHRALLATSSLDNTFAFHDIKTHKTVQTLVPLVADDGGDGGCGITTFAFDTTGILCAIGSDTGIVQIYDLRKLSSGPLATTHVLSSPTTMSSGRNSTSSSNKIIKVQFAPNHHSSSSSSSTTAVIQKGNQQQGLQSSEEGGDGQLKKKTSGVAVNEEKNSMIKKKDMEKEEERKEQDSIKTTHHSNKRMGENIFVHDGTKDTEKPTTSITENTPTTTTAAAATTTTNDDNNMITWASHTNIPTSPSKKIEKNQHDLNKKSTDNTINSKETSRKESDNYKISSTAVGKVERSSPPKMNSDSPTDTTLMTLYSTQRQKLNKILNSNRSENSPDSTMATTMTITTATSPRDNESILQKEKYSKIQSNTNTSHYNTNTRSLVESIEERGNSTTTTTTTTATSPVSNNTQGKFKKESFIPRNVFPDIGVVGEEKSHAESMTTTTTSPTNTLDDGDHMSLLLTRDQVDHRIEEAMDVLRDDIEECIRNLHSEFVKQMYYQETHLVSLIKELQVTMERLKDENDALKEDNARLRNHTYYY